MRSLRFGLMPLVLAVLLTACGGGDGGNDFPPDTYSDKDLCIVKVKGGASVCYGDSREEAEKASAPSSSGPWRTSTIPASGSGTATTRW